MDSCVYGYKRGGKSLFAVMLMHHALSEGRRVCTNIELKPAFFKLAEGQLVHLPDVPTAEHFDTVGMGYEGEVISEFGNGLIVLDECLLIFGSANSRDAEQLLRSKWLVNSGKKRWKVYYLIHSLDAVSKFVRESFFQQVCRVRSLHGLLCIQDKKFSRFIPNVHVVNCSYGSRFSRGFKLPTLFRGKNFYRVYNTEQRYSPRKFVYTPTNVKPFDNEGFLLEEVPPVARCQAIDIRAPFSVLPAPQRQRIFSIMDFIGVFGLLFLLLFIIYTLYISSTQGLATFFHQDKEVVSEAVPVVESSVTHHSTVISNGQCNFFDLVSQHNPGEFSQDWLVQLLKNFDFSIDNLFMKNGFPRYDLLFYNEQGNIIEKTDEKELEVYGWKSANSESGVVLSQISFYKKPDGAVSERAIFIFVPEYHNHDNRRSNNVLAKIRGQ